MVGLDSDCGSEPFILTKRFVDLAPVLKNLQKEPEFQSFVNRETDKVPQFMVETVRNDLGPL